MSNLKVMPSVIKLRVQMFRNRLWLRVTCVAIIWKSEERQRLDNLLVGLKNTISRPSVEKLNIILVSIQIGFCFSLCQRRKDYRDISWPKTSTAISSKSRNRTLPQGAVKAAPWRCFKTSHSNTRLLSLQPLGPPAPIDSLAEQMNSEPAL